MGSWHRVHAAMLHLQIRRLGRPDAMHALLFLVAAQDSEKNTSLRKLWK